MFKIGQIFKKNDAIYCVLDIIEYQMKKYILFSIEKEKLEYAFFEVITNGNGYKLLAIGDEKLNNELFSIMEGVN